MPRDPEKYLFDMLNSCSFLLEYTADRALDDYIQDRGFRSAVERELQIVGEALVQLNKLAPQTAQKINEYQRIISFRHVLVHGYDSLNHDLVWYVIKNKLPTLHDEVRALLSQEDAKQDQP